MVRRGGGGSEPSQADLVDSNRDLRQAIELQGLKKARLLILIILNGHSEITPESPGPAAEPPGSHSVPAPSPAG